MTKLYIKYDQTSYIEREPDPEDSWDRGVYGGTYTVTGVTLTHGWHDYYETDEEILPLDEVYVVWAQYRTGSTFGSEGGQGQIVAVTKDQEAALQAYKWAEDVHYNEKIKVVSDVEWPETLPILHPYWIGYFERLEEVKVDSFTVKP